MNVSILSRWRKITGVLVVFLLLSATGSAAIDNTFFLDFTVKKEGGIDNVSVEITDKDVRIPYMGEGDYRITLNDMDGAEMYSTQTHLSFFRRTLIQTYTVNETRYLARVPYHPNITTIEFSRDGQWSSTINVPEHVCSSSPDDVCLPYCAGKGVDPDCGDVSSGLPIIAIVGGLLAVIIAAGGIYLYRERKKDEPDFDIEPRF